MPPAPEPGGPATVEPLGAPDPAGAVLEAYASGARLRLTTSGSTTRPRPVVRTAASWGDSFAHVGALAGLGPRTRAFVPGPVGATMNLFAAAAVRFLGGSLVDRCEDATHAFVTPAVLARLAAAGDGGGRRVVVAGDRLDAGLRRRAEDRGWRVEHYYGAAELSFVAWGPDAGSLRPFPEVEVEGREGEVWVRSPWVAEAGPGLRSAGGWYTVGDRGGTTPDGRLVVRGRQGVILTGGATVGVADVEAALGGGVVVVPRPHRELGEVVVAVCDGGTDVRALAELARRVLPPSHRPRAWVPVARLPLTAAGKVDRVAAARVAAR